MNKRDKEFLAEARERLKNCVEDENTERAKMQDDLDFCTLDQWDANIRKERENDPNGARAGNDPPSFRTLKKKLDAMPPSSNLTTSSSGRPPGARLTLRAVSIGPR